MKLGASTIANAKLGTTQVAKIYLGSGQVWEYVAPTEFIDTFERADGPPGNGWGMVNFGGHNVSSGIVSGDLYLMTYGDFWGTADDAGGAFRLLILEDDYKISTIVTSNPGGSYARLLMLRESLAAGSRMVCTVQNGGNDQLNLLWRDSTDGTCDWQGGNGQVAHVGLRQELRYEPGLISLYVNDVFVYSRVVNWVPAFAGLVSSGGGAAYYEDFREELTI